MHALINPSGAVDCISSAVDPGVATKSGWRWLPYEATPRPAADGVSEYQPSDTVGASSVVRVWTEVAQPLANLKSALAEQIDAEAERCRMAYVTPGTGMAMTYREKLEQAEHVIAGGQAAADAMSAEAAKSAYPTLAASVGIEGATLWACAQIVWGKYQIWAQISHEIEKSRLAGKKAVSDAADAAAARLARAAVTFPFPA